MEPPEMRPTRSPATLAPLADLLQLVVPEQLPPAVLEPDVQRGVLGAAKAALYDPAHPGELRPARAFADPHRRSRQRLVRLQRASPRPGPAARVRSGPQPVYLPIAEGVGDAGEVPQPSHAPPYGTRPPTKPGRTRWGVSRASKARRFPAPRARRGRRRLVAQRRSFEATGEQA